MKIKGHLKVCRYDCKILFREIRTSTQHRVHVARISVVGAITFLWNIVSLIFQLTGAFSHTTPINNLTRHYYERVLRCFAHVLHYTWLRGDIAIRRLSSSANQIMHACDNSYRTNSVVHMNISCMKQLSCQCVSHAKQSYRILYDIYTILHLKVYAHIQFISILINYMKNI